MSRARSNTQQARWVTADLWGLVLNSHKNLFPLFVLLYNPYQRPPPNFVLRVDFTRPQKKRRLLSRYALGMLERRRLSAFYGLTIPQLCHLASRTRLLPYAYSQNFLFTLESMLFTICWRTGFFLKPTDVRTHIRCAKVFVNNLRSSAVAFSCQPGDFVTFEDLDPTQFLKNLHSRFLRLRDHHLMTNFRLFCVYYLRVPEPTNLFFPSPLDHRYVFFMKRYRKR